MKQKTIYALGFFDGVHLGHQALLAACRDLADKQGCKAGAVTFTSHPDALVSGHAPKLMNTIEDRKRLLTAYGMDCIAEIPFDEALRKTHWSDFLNQLIDGGAAGFVCGDDFRFGAGGSGTAKKLSAFCQSRGIPYAVVPEQLLGNVRVSSTHIRSLLEEGNMAEAVAFLGHPHIFTGTVVQGRQLGRTMDFPTANLRLPEQLLLPRLGVYACKALVDGKEYPAVANIGTRPTVCGDGVNLEAHLLDFCGDLYGKELTLSFYVFLRPEEKFSSLEELTAEIQKNVTQTRNFFEKSV